MRAKWITCTGLRWSTKITATQFRKMCRLTGKNVRRAKKGVPDFPAAAFEAVAGVRTVAWPACVWVVGD